MNQPRDGGENSAENLRKATIHVETAQGFNQKMRQLLSSCTAARAHLSLIGARKVVLKEPTNLTLR